MRRELLVLVLLAMTSPLLWAQEEYTVNPVALAEGPPIAYLPGPNSLTQSLDTSLIVPGSVACAGADDSYLRRFSMAEYRIFNRLDVASIDVGIEYARGASVTVNLYTIDRDAPLTWANLELVGSATVDPFPDTTLAIVNLPVIGSVTSPGAHDLVVEVFAPDFSGEFSFFIGSNPNGQTAPTYLSAALCGAAEPTETALLGAPNMHMVLVVNAQEYSPVPGLGAIGLIVLPLLLLATGCLLLRPGRA